MPFNDLQEELKNREQVEDQLAGLDKENQDEQSALPTQGVAEQQDQPLEDAFKESATPPQVAINSVQNNDKFVVDEQIRIPLDLSGAPRDRLSISYTAQHIDNSNYGEDGVDQVDLDETGAGSNEWTFKGPAEGTYLVRVTVDNGKVAMTQEVLLQVVAPDGQPVAEELARDAPPSADGQGADQQLTFAS